MADDKYITFRREPFLEMIGHWTTQDMSRRQVPSVLAEIEMQAINDAVVIRRQDLFASPCLATYASMISLVASNISDKAQAKELQRIADYFEDQANLAAAEGYKLPDV